MTGAQALEAKGRRVGRKEGRVEGRVEGRCQLLIELLEAKFGPLDGGQTAALMALDEARVKELGVRVLTAASLDDMGIS